MNGAHPQGAPDPRDRRSAARAWFWLAALALLLAALFLSGLAAGSVPIPVGDAAGILFRGMSGMDGSGGAGWDPVWERILWQIRLPRCLTAALAGAALALSGLEMQTLFRNPLAGPYSMGISSGATLGVALAVLAGAAAGAGAEGSGLMAMQGVAAQLGAAGSAIAGAAAVMLLVLAVSRRIQGDTTLLILGLMLGQMAGALVSVLQAFSTSEEIRAFAFWGFGSYAGVTWAQMPVLAGAVLAGSAMGAWCAKPLNALLLGNTYARSLGVPVRTLRALLLASTSILAGSVTAFCGPVAFLGLAVPHLCRGLFRTADHRVLIPACLLLGGSLSLAADLAARLPGGNRALPLNAVTALIGAPVVIWVLVRRRASRDG